MPRSQSKLEAVTADMIEGFADNVLSGAPRGNCASDLELLIDIATFNDPQADAASSYAEKKLMDIYADSIVSPDVRESMISQLVETRNILLEGSRPNSSKFSLPASLLHLTAQHVCGNEKTNLVIDPVPLEDIDSDLAEACGLLDENTKGGEIFDSERYVTTDEVCAAIKGISCGYHREINLSDQVTPEMKREQIRFLFDHVIAHGFVVAPLLSNNHFMLAAVKKKPKSNEFQVHIANSNLLEDKTSADYFKRSLIKQFSDHAGEGRKFRVLLHQVQLQKNVTNSCGPWISLLAKDVRDRYGRKDFQVSKTFKESFAKFGRLSPEQQKNLIMAERSRMIGHTAVLNERRFAFPDIGNSRRG